MFHIRPEGQELKNGFNFYPLSEWKYSRGFVFRWYGYKRYIRYSVKLKKWFLC